MGLYHTIRIGAGVKIPIQTEEYKTTEKKCSCRTHHHDYNFCQFCGEEIKQIEVVKHHTLCADDLIGSENLFSQFDGDYMLLLSNYGKGEIPNSENQIISLSNSIIEKNKNDFKEYHKDDLEKLKIKTGLDIEVGFFFYHDYS